MKYIAAFFTFFLLVAYPVLKADKSLSEQQTTSESNSNRLILYTVSKSHTDKTINIELEDDYGFVIVNIGNDNDPKPLFRLALRIENKILDSHTFDDFKAALKKIPRHSTLYHYDKCLVSLSYGFQFNWDLLKQTCKDFDIILNETPRTTCTCSE